MPASRELSDCTLRTQNSATTPTKRTAERSLDGSCERANAALAASWAGVERERFVAWWDGASDESKLSLLKSTASLVRQRLAEQGASAALDALCPEFSERLLARLVPGDAVPQLIEARVSVPAAAREHDAGFIRASWGAVPPGMLSPMRGASRKSAAPPPASPAALAAQLSALANESRDWDAADVLTDNRGILQATFWCDLLLLSKQIARGVAGRIAPLGERQPSTASPPPAPQTVAPTSHSSPTGSFRLEPAESPRASEGAPSESDGESTPVPEE